MKFSADDATKSTSYGPDDEAAQHVGNPEQRSRRSPAEYTAVYQLKYQRNKQLSQGGRCLHFAGKTMQLV